MGGDAAGVVLPVRPGDEYYRRITAACDRGRCGNVILQLRMLRCIVSAVEFTLGIISTWPQVPSYDTR